MQYLLDACTIINLLHIDEDDYLLKKLSLLKFNICSKVFEETQRNVYKKFDRINPYPVELKKIIEKKLIYFRKQIFNNLSYLEMEDSISSTINYPKKNGEYFSTILAFYLNTIENSHILFFTDDYPARTYFNSHFNHNKIGYIEDSVDLLILLYRRNDEFSKNDLKKFLTALFSEYALEISSFEKEILELEIPLNIKKKPDIHQKISDLRFAIRTSDFDKLTDIYKEVCYNQKKYTFIFNLLTKYASLFEKNLSSAFLIKVRENIKYVDSKPFFKYFSN